MGKYLSTIPVTSGAIYLLLTLCSASHAQIELTGNQVFTVSAGDNYSTAITRDSSHLIVNGGTIQGQVIPTDFSTLHINGGSIGLITSAKDATINITGGIVSSFFTGDRNTVTMTGGRVSLFSVEQASSVQIQAGRTDSTFSALSDINLFGGTHDQIFSLLTGNILIYGSDFSLSAPTPGTYTTSTMRFDGNYYTLMGKLQNNSSVATYRLFDAITRTRISTGEVTAAPGEFVFVSVPEPGAAALLLLGGAMTFLWRRTR